MPSNRGYASGHFGLELDGINAGYLYSAEGGTAKGNVVTEKLGTDQWQFKHITGVSYDDITISFGSGLARAPYKWIADSLQHTYSRKSGAVIQADFDMKEQSRMTFMNALITEMTLPGCDAASKDASKITLKISPEITRVTSAKGPALDHGISPAKQKTWTAADFRLSIDGIDCTKVSKVEVLTIKQKNVEHTVGDEKDSQKEPAYIEVPNLVITMAESHAKDMFKWHDDFVIKGKSSSKNERTGVLEYMSPNLKETLFSVDFFSLGLFAVTQDKSEAHSENIRRVKCEMYCDHFAFKMGKGVWG